MNQRIRGVTVSRTAEDLVRYHGKIAGRRELWVMGSNRTFLDTGRSRRAYRKCLRRRLEARGRGARGEDGRRRRASTGREGRQEDREGRRQGAAARGARRWRN